jgi:hypothetical protein
MCVLLAFERRIRCAGAGSARFATLFLPDPPIFLRSFARELTRRSPISSTSAASPEDAHSRTRLQPHFQAAQFLAPSSPSTSSLPFLSLSFPPPHLPFKHVSSPSSRIHTLSITRRRSRRCIVQEPLVPLAVSFVARAGSSDPSFFPLPFPSSHSREDLGRAKQASVLRATGEGENRVPAAAIALSLCSFSCLRSLRPPLPPLSFNLSEIYQRSPSP